MPKTARKVCEALGCPEPIPHHRTVCGMHSRAPRASRQARGYDRVHVAIRKQWEPRVAAGVVPCSRCGDRIAPGEDWHLDHDDEDRSRYRGPSHKLCNLSAAGRKAHETSGNRAYPLSRAW